MFTMSNVNEFNDVTKIGSTVKNMPLSMLHISPVQRSKNEKRIAQIVKEFDNRRIGVISVVKFNGKFVVIDGMHRCYALGEICRMQGVNLSDVFLDCQVYKAKDEIELCDLLDRLNSNSSPLSPSDYLFSQKNVPGTAGYAFMNLLNRLGISVYSSSSKSAVVLTGITRAFDKFRNGNEARRETVEDALRLLKLIAIQKTDKSILSKEFDLMMSFAYHGGDLKSARVREAVIKAGEALYIKNDNAEDVSSEARLNHFITVLNLYMNRSYSTYQRGKKIHWL